MPNVILGCQHRVFHQRDAERYGAPKHTSDWREVAGDASIDGVSVATPDFLHTEIAVGMAEAGKHVLVEKPVGVTVAEIQALKEAADRAGRLRAVRVLARDEARELAKAVADAIVKGWTAEAGAQLLAGKPAQVQTPAGPQGIDRLIADDAGEPRHRRAAGWRFRANPTPPNACATIVPQFTFVLGPWLL